MRPVVLLSVALHGVWAVANYGSKIAEAEAVVSVNKKKWFVMHGSKIAEAEAVVSVIEKKWLVMHVQLRLDELRGPQTLGSLSHGVWAPNPGCGTNMTIYLSVPHMAPCPSCRVLL
jgi:hypothetical protein